MGKLIIKLAGNKIFTSLQSSTSLVPAVNRLAKMESASSVTGTCAPVNVIEDNCIQI